MKKMVFLFLFLYTGTCFLSCKKLIAVDEPKTQLTPEKAFSDEQSATAVLSSIYSLFNGSIAGTFFTTMGLYSDELMTTSANTYTNEYYKSRVTITNSNNQNTWRNFYNVIYQCNALLENIAQVNGLDAETMKRLKGEALFLRGVSYFYLVNIYGDVPRIVTTDVNITSVASRAPVSTIYEQVIADLSAAKDLLPVTYISGEKVNANKWAAAGMLARVQLYLGHWNEAEVLCNEVINSGDYTLTIPYAEVFIKSSPEAILQFWTLNGFVTPGGLFIPSGTGMPVYPVSAYLLNDFEPNDLRKTAWLKSTIVGGQTYYYPYKYRNRVTTSGTTAEYLVFMRLAELYLIRAEARVHLNALAGAASDINVIRNRAGLATTGAVSPEELLAAIQQERRVELFTEWGERFFNLKRTGQADAILGSIKTGWKPEAQLLPIPYYEMSNNSSLVQNPGY